MKRAPSQALFEEVMPDPLHNVPNIPMMVEFACLAKIEIHQKARKKKCADRS
jgi:hypothetical protein